MLNKSQSISVRLSAEDYDYLMHIEQNGAVTQSEKVRELIRMTREQIGTQSFTRAYLCASDAVAPYRALSKDIPDTRSDIVDGILDFIGEAAAAVQATDKNDQFVPQLEQRLLPVSENLIARLLPSFLQSQTAQLANAENITPRAERIRHLIAQLQTPIRKE